MRNYYCLVAGLPDITIDDTKLNYTIDQFYNEIKEDLHTDDLYLIKLYLLSVDNKNLLTYLQDKEAKLLPSALFTSEDFDELIRKVKEDEPITDKSIPRYIITFLREYLDESKHNNNTSYSWENRITTLYYEQLCQTKNKFFNEWYSLNLNINNILSAFAARKHGVDIESNIIGHNHVSQLLRKSGARDFGLSDELEYFSEISKIAEDADLMERERRLDNFKWSWLDENCFFHYFSIEPILSFIIKLEMTQRWLALDKITGEQMFRRMISDLKKEVELPDEFK